MDKIDISDSGRRMKNPSESKWFREIQSRLLEPADLDRWMVSRSPVLSALQISCCGLYAEAHRHRCRRAEGEIQGSVLIYCIAGEGYAKLGGREVSVREGDMLYCPAGVAHEYGAASGNPWTIWWFHLAGKQRAQYERLLGVDADRLLIHVGVQDEIVNAFRTLLGRYCPPYDESRLFAIQTQAALILSQFTALTKSSAEPSRQTRMIRAAVTRMEAALDRPFDLKALAREADCAPAYFSRVFKQVIGMPPVVHFNRRKMQQAQVMLQASDVQIKEVALQLGYADPLYFSKCFRKQFGRSPESCRKR